jgi:4'-phosphopantetheinyl transferase EntD
VHWHCDPLAKDAQGLIWPTIQATALTLTSKENSDARLLAEETALAASMKGSRLRDFTCGRHSAHLAQTLLGLSECPVLQQGRAPVWAPGLCGSISHSQQLALAGVTTLWRSIGVDVELIDRVTPKLHNSLFLPEEISALALLPAWAPAVAFSAKEAGYKAIYPLVGEFIGFHQASIDLHWESQEFRIRYHGAHSGNNALESGIGHWRIAGDHVITLFLIQD